MSKSSHVNGNGTNGTNGDLRKRPVNGKSTPATKSEISKVGREADRKLEVHTTYEFGGPIGVSIMITIFPPIMYYLWICLWFYDGALVHPTGITDILPFLGRMWDHVRNDAAPNTWSVSFYVGLMVFQLLLAFIMPGYQQEGLPVPSLNYKTLTYNCNALACWYATLVASVIVHTTGILRLTGIIDNFGPVMTVSIIWGFGLSLVTYWVSLYQGTSHRMSGNFIYDFFMGAVLNPRIGNVDLKMFQEVRIPWVLLFYICVGGACKQYEDYGYVSANAAFMVLATGLYINACAKGEECIPQTWDMFYEKDGFMLIFWNFAGVPFTYCYPTLYMVRRHPDTYKFPLWGNIALYSTLMIAHYIFDTSMAQKSHFKMQMQGVYQERMTFPQWPWSTIKNPNFIQTAHGNKLLTSGWWAFARKPNYSADWIQSLTWGLSAGFSSIIPYYYSVFFFVVLVHRCSRDFERCAQKYGKDWEEYCRRVPYKFIPGVY
ncbi:C-24(28) sterol reductase [Tulasnella sp. JGI-2019a]|nr:C-24(28) sterol reductase [Tulasnella sp. JGI-2019a]